MRRRRQEIRSVEHERLIPHVPAEEAAELRHRLSNNMQLVLALIAKESASSHDPAVKEALHRLAERVEEISWGQKSVQRADAQH